MADLLEASAGRALNVMFPMVSEPWEFDAARKIVEEQRATDEEKSAERREQLARAAAVFGEGVAS